MTYTLLYWLFSSAAMLPATGTATYATEKACQQAIVALQAFPGDAGGICTPVGDDAPVATPAAPTTRQAAPTPVKGAPTPK